MMNETQYETNYRRDAQILNAAAIELDGWISLEKEVQEYSRRQQIGIFLKRIPNDNDTIGHLRTTLEQLLAHFGFENKYGKTGLCEELYDDVMSKLVKAYPTKNRSGCRKKRLSKQ